MFRQIIKNQLKLFQNMILRQHQVKCFSKSAEEGESVLASTSGNNCLITLSRPKQLNALNHTMVKRLYQVLYQWNKDRRNIIVIKGAGDKAFCAGGDVVAVTRDTTGKAGAAFFTDEYKTNALIGSLQVPYVALIDGIVMGGGVGLSVHGRYRVATERTMFAMPETQIGLFPDVGAAHVLSRLQNNLGYFLGVSGYRLKGYDVLHTQIATHFCLSNKLAELENELLSCSSPCPVDAILTKFQQDSVKEMGGKVPEFSLNEHMSMIQNCFSTRSVEEILARLNSNGSKFAEQLTDTMSKMSPLAMKVSVRLIEKAGKTNLYECLNMDYRIASRFVKEAEFAEGVRALLVDKDKKPRWNPSTLEQVTEDMVDRYFQHLPAGEELNLPKSMLPPSNL